MNKLTPARVNNETGDTMCVVRWMAETPDGWLGAWDKEAFDAFIKDAVAAERERCAKVCETNLLLTKMDSNFSRGWHSALEACADAIRKG